ncbi:hypothetical protein [Rhodovulum sp.]|uniref:hypothetical protein n=1 Tax=Rhodovulum sp. TaxID=34009 RepID=UPI0025794C05|nr:hypothetical protein [Rhodovulum sp.]
MVNGPMAKPRKTVMGIHAPPPRPTRAGALWLALAITLPLAGLLGLFLLVIPF